LGKAITTVTIIQEGEIRAEHLTAEKQQAHIEKVQRIIDNIADGDVSVSFRLEEE
jgi:hypothetical protein